MLFRSVSQSRYDSPFVWQFRFHLALYLFQYISDRHLMFSYSEGMQGLDRHNFCRHAEYSVDPEAKAAQKLSMQKLKWIGRFEGISLLLLFFVAMPMKYIYGHPEFVRVIGLAHGILFLAFIALLMDVGSDAKWNRSRMIFGVFLSSVPFGTFYFERKYLRS